MKSITYGANKLNRTRTNLFMHTQTPSATIQGNITAMRYRNSVGSSASYPCQSRYDVGTGLRIMSRG